MRKSLLTSALTVCIGLVAMTAWVLSNPTPAAAANGAADCGNGLQATCAAFTCFCVDGEGCTGFDAKWHITSVNTCIGKRHEHEQATQGDVIAE